MGKKRIITKGDTEGAASSKVEGVSGTNDGGQGNPQERQHVQYGAAYILATYNNTLISIADENGNTIAWSSAGAMGFKGTKKATPYAASRAAEAVAEKAKKWGITGVTVFVKGVGSGRESAIRSLANYGLDIAMIKDITPIPHNGPRPSKVRRV
ncbi:MAG: 30S ribosomal protein S11 [Candidatus Sungbacteria bacterium]|nr:30S ribosomal protein S11 [Candidatus Sungbacteria bacterium]